MQSREDRMSGETGRRVGTSSYDEITAAEAMPPPPRPVPRYPPIVQVARLLGCLSRKALVSADRQAVPHVDRGNGHQQLHNFLLLE